MINFFLEYSIAKYYFWELPKAWPTKYVNLQRVTVSQIVPACFKFFRVHLKLFLCFTIHINSLKSIAFWFSRQFYLLLFLFLFLFLFWLATLKNGCMLISPSYLLGYYFVTISLLFRYYFVTIYYDTVYAFQLYVNRPNVSLDTWFK